MKNTTKGALAVGAAGVLLLGGGGSLAYWSGSEQVGSADIASGSIALSTPDCTTAPNHDWQLDDGSAYDPGTTLLVPGDDISRVCTMTLDLSGEHIGAELAIDTAGVTADAASTLDDELTASATFTVDGAAYVPIAAAGSHTVRATVTVTFDGADATNGSMSGDVDLDAISVTATQTHAS